MAHDVGACRTDTAHVQRHVWHTIDLHQIGGHIGLSQPLHIQHAIVP